MNISIPHPAGPYKIWQIFYREGQRICLDPNFIPFDNSLSTDELLEFSVFSKLHLGSDYSESEYFGVVSWRFFKKTGLTGTDLIAYLRANQNIDLFYINPYPENEALHQTLWLHGATAHPRFLEVSAGFFKASGLDSEDLFRFTSSKDFSVCNYFVAKPAFWKVYIPFIQGCLDSAEANMDPWLRDKMHSSDGDCKGVHKGATYIPFIIERMLPTFLRSPEGRLLRTHQIPLPVKEAKLNEDLLELREMKDVAILARSTRILDLWREKRKAYCSIYFSKAWNERNMRFLNDAPVVW